jgi:hypothetical protein
MNGHSKQAIRQIRRAGVPLAAIETADPALTIKNCYDGLSGKAETIPLMQWDMVRGLVGMNRPGKEMVSSIAPDGPIQTGNPTECLALLADKEPKDSLIFWHGAQSLLSNPSFVQALWNVRDVFRSIGSHVLMVGPAFTLPAELKNDVLVLSEDLPNAEELLAIVRSIIADAALPTLAQADEGKAVDALLGLSSFAAEQALALSVTPEGLDLSGLWERKRKMIEQTPGLSVWRGGESFEGIGGCGNVKGFMRDILNGNKAPRAIVFIDEIEKALSGTAGDLSGVSQDYLGALLSFMQDRQAAGVIFIGPPGAAKSAVAKATGNAGNIPTISFDLGAMKGSLVGQSEQQLRQALKVCDAVSQGKTLFIATCNSFGNLPPELKRRFTLGTFFFDLPTQEERAAIWAIYRKVYDLQGDGSTVHDEGWTGAEIKQCCDIAFRLKRSIAEASKFIVPVSRSAADTILTLRKQASGKFISATNPGFYEYQEKPDKPLAGRKFSQV